MTQTTRDQVIFEILSEIEGIPPGSYTGYVDHMIIPMRGQTITQLSRAMVHIERSKYPELFSPNNSMISIDYDITKHVLTKTVTYR